MLADAVAQPVADLSEGGQAISRAVYLASLGTL